MLFTTYIMKIIETYFNEDELILEIRFNIDPDSDYYRSLKLSKEDIQYYSPTIIEDDEISELDNDLLIEILESYFDENDMVEEEFL
jgi:hypothetical protein